MEFSCAIVETDWLWNPQVRRYYKSSVWSKKSVGGSRQTQYALQAGIWFKLRSAQNSGGKSTTHARWRSLFGWKSLLCPQSMCANRLVACKGLGAPVRPCLDTSYVVVHSSYLENIKHTQYYAAIHRGKTFLHHSQHTKYTRSLVYKGVSKKFQGSILG